MSKHTPGPWAAYSEADGSYGVYESAERGGDLLFTVERTLCGKADATNGPNAQIAAAAPELAEALRALLGPEVAYDHLAKAGFPVRCRFCGYTKEHTEKCPTHFARAALRKAGCD
jgi:hypothetical protein